MQLESRGNKIREETSYLEGYSGDELSENCSDLEYKFCLDEDSAKTLLPPSFLNQIIQVYGYIDRQTLDRYMDRWIEGQMDRRIDGQMDRWIDGQMDRQINVQMDRQINGQMDRQINGQMDTDRQMDRWILDIYIWVEDR